MTQRTFFTMATLLAAVSAGTAGTITNGVWSASGCGTERGRTGY